VTLKSGNLTLGKLRSYVIAIVLLSKAWHLAC